MRPAIVVKIHVEIPHKSLTGEIGTNEEVEEHEAKGGAKAIANRQT